MDEVEYRGPGRLFISDIQSVAEQPSAQFDVVVSVCQDTVEDNVGCEYWHYNLADDEQSKERWGGSCDYDDFAEAMLHLTELLLDEKTVCLHCHHGRNRSVTVAVGALSVLLDITPRHALDIVTQHRPEADPKVDTFVHTSRFNRQRRF
jgi:protein-tyrosine phosphatase